MKEEFDFYSKTSLKSYNLDERIRYQLKMLDSLDGKQTTMEQPLICLQASIISMVLGMQVYPYYMLQHPQ